MLQQDGSERLAIRSLLLVVVCAALFSFSERTGGDTFAIYLNNKLLLKERVLPEAPVKSLLLNAGDADGTMKVQYSHCGQIGVERSLSVQDNHNKVLKTWDFSDSASPVMEFAVTELLTVGKNSPDQRLQLVYSSKELREGKLLAHITVPASTRASLK